MTLVDATLKTRVTPYRRNPQHLLGDRAYDSDPLRKRLAARGITLTSPYRGNNLHRRYEDRRRLRTYRHRWIIEGAGGLLVPINERETMADLMRALDLPVLIAARSTLGTINHTVLTIEGLRRRMLRVAGVVMVGEPNDENRLAIEKYGAAEVVAHMPRFDPLTPDALERWVATDFDRGGVLFGCLR